MPLVEQYTNWVTLDPVLHYKQLADCFYDNQSAWQSRQSNSFFSQCGWYKFPYCCHVPWYQDLNKLPLLDQAECEFYRLSVPMFDHANQQLGKNFVMWGAELNSVPPGGSVEFHTDKHFYSDYTTRIHIVLQTATDAVFKFDSGNHHFGAGECFIFNNKLRHSIQNSSDVPRLHLVMDFVPLEVFKYAERSIAPFGGHGAQHILARLSNTDPEYSNYVKLAENQPYPFRTAQWTT